MSRVLRAGLMALLAVVSVAAGCAHTRQPERAIYVIFHFQDMGAALDWLREHKLEVALGTVVVIGGVVAAPYVVAILGGALVLAPL